MNYITEPRVLNDEQIEAAHAASEYDDATPARTWADAAIEWLTPARFWVTYAAAILSIMLTLWVVA